MSTADAIREAIAFERRRGEISGNTALILRDILDLVEAKQADTQHNCAECARRQEWAAGAKV